MNDKTTGLPELPAGHFWRISKFNYTPSPFTLEVGIRRKVGFWSVEVGSCLAKASEPDIRAAAESALNRARDSLRARERISDRVQYLGDYPPKTLGASDE